MPARILIIEDNPANLELAKFLLEAYGYSALAAVNGAEGIRVARETIPDLILCDLQMPGLDGHGVLAEIRGDPVLDGSQLGAARLGKQMLTVDAICVAAASDAVRHPPA